MNSRSRINPNINSYFMQMKAYEHHRRKIQEIQRSRSKQKCKTKTDLSQIINQAPQTQTANNIKAIKKQIKRELKRRLSPRVIQDQFEIRKENHRLLERIQKWQKLSLHSASTINRKAFEKHQIQNQKIKKQLSRFAYSPLSNKVILKCKQSLELLRKRSLDEQKNLYRDQSRIIYAKSQASRIQTEGNGINQSNSASKKSLINRFDLLKRRSKKKRDYQKCNLQKQQRNFEKLRFNFWSGRKKAIKTEAGQVNTIFSTEIQ